MRFARFAFFALLTIGMMATSVAMPRKAHDHWLLGSEQALLLAHANRNRTR
jgi:hypothetical protein